MSIRAQLMIPGVPVSLLLFLADSTLAFAPGFGPGFKGIVEDRPLGEVQATFFNDCIRFTQDGVSEDYAYGSRLPYKALPLVKQWLIQQEIPNPFRSEQ